MCHLPKGTIVVCVMVEQTEKGRRKRARATVDQKQPTEGCTNEEVARYEASYFGDGGSRTNGGDGS